MIRDDDYYAQAMHARQDIPAGLLWAMLKSQVCLGLGFVGASVAAVALRQLFMAQPGRLAPLELALAAIVGIVVAVLAWRRAVTVLRPVADEVPATGSKVLVEPPVSALLGGYSRG